MHTLPTTTEAPARRARCYAEYCCNTATHDVVLVDRSFRQVGDTRPRNNPIPWGWCTQHLHWK